MQNELLPHDIFKPLIPVTKSTLLPDDDNVQGTLETVQTVKEEQSAVISDHAEEVEKIVQKNMEEEPEQPKWTDMEESTANEWSELNQVKFNKCHICNILLD